MYYTKEMYLCFIHVLITELLLKKQNYYLKTRDMHQYSISNDYKQSFRSNKYKESYTNFTKNIKRVKSREHIISNNISTMPA